VIFDSNCTNGLADLDGGHNTLGPLQQLQETLFGNHDHGRSITEESREESAHGHAYSVTGTVGDVEGEEG
jgi:hypothetical protein